MSKKSVFVIFALWVLLILTVLCYSLAGQTRVEVAQTKAIIDSYRAYDLARSGVYMIRDKLLSARTDENKELQNRYSAEVNFFHPSRTGELAFGYSDAAANININAVPAAELETFLDFLGSRRIIKDHDKIYEYVFPSADLNDRRVPACKEQIYSELKISLEDTADMDKIFTVYGKSCKLNINCVSEYLLNIMLGYFADEYDVPEDICSEILSGRYRKDEEGNQIVPPFNQQSWQDILDLSGQYSKVIEQWLTIEDSSAVNITGSARVGNIFCEIEAVFDTNEMRFLYWYEN